MHTYQCILKSAGIDYITLSSVQKQTKKHMGRLYGRILAEDLRLGYTPVPVGMYGYVGKRSRHATMATKDHRALLTVSGQRAQPALIMCFPGDSCARIDVQVTVQIAPGNVNRFLDAAERVARSSAPTRGRPVTVKAIRGADGNETVYIGSKKSDVLLRLYDKFRESQDARWRDCVRLEVQLRGKPAQRVWDHCASAEGNGAYPIAVLLGYLERRGIDTSWIPSPWSYVRPPSEATTKESVTLAWLATQVASSIKKQARSVPWFQLFEALFVDVLTRHEMRAILAWATLHYGN